MPYFRRTKRESRIDYNHGYVKSFVKLNMVHRFGVKYEVKINTIIKLLSWMRDSTTLRWAASLSTAALIWPTSNRGSWSSGLMLNNFQLALKRRFLIRLYFYDCYWTWDWMKGFFSFTLELPKECTDFFLFSFNVKWLSFGPENFINFGSEVFIWSRFSILKIFLPNFFIDSPRSDTRPGRIYSM